MLIAATHMPTRIATGPLTWIDGACAWESNCRRRFDYPLQPREAASGPFEDAVGIDATMSMRLMFALDTRAEVQAVWEGAVSFVSAIGGHMPAPSRRIDVAFVVGVFAALVGCAGVNSQGSGPSAEAPAYRVGDRWVYRGDDGFRQKTRWEETHEVTAIGAEGITVRITQKGASIDVSRTELWSSPGRVKVGAVCDSETRRFAATLQRYDFPLADGKTWNQRVENYNEATKARGNIGHYVRVRGWDRLTTPAGTFDAVSMQVIMRLGDDMFWRTATECNYLVWYAPAVRGIVREEMDAGYREKDGALDGGGVVTTRHGVRELVLFMPGEL